jgi:Na+/H+ antiporter NhaD/arsenite permease-like protein
MDVWLAGAIFLIAYGAIATERVDRTLSALLGGLLVVALGIIGQAEALAAIDFNVIFLLAGMMVLAGALGRTGVLEWLAIRAVKASRGHPMRLLVYLALITAVLSAFLDNVTTVVVMAPITLHIAATLGVSPYPYLISQILASNIGGTATLIGDPPNIMIGSAAGLDFGAFLVNLTPLVALILVAFTLTLGLLFGQQLKVPDDRREAVLEMEEARALTDRRLLKRALPIVAATVVALLFHSALGLEAATIALLGATVLMLFGGLDPKEALRDIEWSTLAFFVGLFMLVEGIVHVGIVGGIADSLAQAAGGQGPLASVVLLWFSAVASAIVDNIPFTATAIPVVQRLVENGLPAQALWWSLALGACLGGNLTIVGASANVVVADAAARAGYPIRFGQFLRYGSIVVGESLVISTLYVWVRYLG